ncbi:GNAT family N-acetyltransferase [Hoyosella subflava]|nr:GNAT family protein [Hoyosella subflava]
MNQPGWPANAGPVTIAAGEVRLRPVRLRDATSWSRYRLQDEDYLRPWEPSGPGTWEGRHRASSWPSVCMNLRNAGRKGMMLPFAIELDGQFCGQLTVGNMVRGPLCSAWIGYWIAKDLAGKGIATTALALGVDHCFRAVGLHRLEATVRPENEASQSVLRRVGFRDEGFLRRYLHVDGDWRDHKLVAILTDDYPDTAISRLVRQGRAQW